MMRRAMTWVAVACLGLSVAWAGCMGKRRPQGGQEADSQEKAAAPTKLVQPDDVDDKLADLVGGERARVTYDEKTPVKGAANPVVTIVEYSDFQCPYCSRLTPILDEVVEAYPEDVRLVFKQFPLGMHADAEPAARAVLAAHEQGKFWAMHDKIFANAKALKPADLERYAKEEGLDVAKFKARSNADDLQARVNAELAQGKAVGVRGTPTVFVNGRLEKAARTVEGLKQIIEEEKALADKLMAAGSKREEVYARIIRKGADVTPQVEAQEKKADPKFRRGDMSKIPNYAVPLGEGRPSKGAPGALVTIVEFGAFDCDDCRKAAKTIDAIRKKYPGVRSVFRQLPGEGKGAEGMARASLAAHAQGRFWQMRDKLLAGPTEVSNELLLEYAKAVGLKPKKFVAAMLSDSVTKMLEDDKKMGAKFRGSASAPIFYVNGRFLSGTPSLQDFDALIAEEQDKARAFLKENEAIKKNDIYEAMRKSKKWRGYEMAQKVLDGA